MCRLRWHAIPDARRCASAIHPPGSSAFGDSPRAQRRRFSMCSKSAAICWLLEQSLEQTSLQGKRKLRKIIETQPSKSRSLAG